MNYLSMVICLILNLDWKPVPIIPKFVDIVVNGINERMFDLKAYAQDPFAIKERTDYVEGVIKDLRSLERKITNSTRNRY